jgi:hypothetical protein
MVAKAKAVKEVRLLIKTRIYTYVYESRANRYPATKDFNPKLHAVSTTAIRDRAIALGLTETPATAAIIKKNNWARVGNSPKLAPATKCDFVTERNTYYNIPVGECSKLSHSFNVSTIKEWAVKNLAMNSPEFNTVERVVEKIVTKQVEVIKEIEVPFAASFEQKEVMTNAFHREQHILNESIRLAMEDNSVGRVAVYTSRLRALKETMAMLGVPEDAYYNTKAWMLELDLSIAAANQEKQFEAFPVEEEVI